MCTNVAGLQLAGPYRTNTTAEEFRNELKFHLKGSSQIPFQWRVISKKKNFKGNIWEKHISKAEAHSKTSQPSEVKLCLNAVNNLKQFTSTNILSYKMKLFCGYSWQLWVFNYFHTKLLFRCLIYRCTAWKVFKYGVWSLFSRIWTEYIYSRMCSECTSEK